MYLSIFYSFPIYHARSLLLFYFIHDRKKTKIKLDFGMMPELLLSSMHESGSSAYAHEHWVGLQLCMLQSSVLQ